MRYAASALFTCALFLGAGSAAAQAPDSIGSAVQVVNLVTAELARATRSLRIGDGVHQNEIIEVASDGAGELKLRDDTKLALGPGSRLVLDKFVFDGERTGGSIMINLAKGTLRFITGVAEKPAYVIRVPAASITVRGTIFDVFVEESGRSWLLLQEGAVRVCNDRGRCRDHNEPGKLIRITESGDLGKPSKWTSLPGVERISFDNAFPFVVAPPTIDPAPIFTRGQIVDAVLPPRVRYSGTRQENASTGDDHDDAPDRPTRGGKTGKMDTSKLGKHAKEEQSERRRKLIKGLAALAPVIAERIRERRDGYQQTDLGGTRRKIKLSSDALKKGWRKPPLSKPQ